MSFTAAILSFVAICIATFAAEWRKSRRRRQEQLDFQRLYGEQIKKVRIVELSDKRAAQIFQRRVGSFGYYYLRKSETYDGTPCWVAPFNIGDGSGYDTAERAEEYARLNVAGEA